jgi:ABC-type dipeptide/oligopeptide/nickel transport system ATPase subunit
MPPEVVASAREVSVEYQRSGNRLIALNRVSLDIPAAALLGIAGRSGCGKSTLARCLAGWQRPSSGAIDRSGAVQLVVQDPGRSLNPRFSALDAVAEPAVIAGRSCSAQTLLDHAGIARSQRTKRTAEFSGGERARIAIARALCAMKNDAGLLILDESLSSLDPETRKSILDWLEESRTSQGLALMIISHDLGLLAGTAKEIAIFEAGRIVEQANAARILNAPRHSATQALVAAMSLAA